MATLLHTVGYTNSDRYKCLENLQKGAVDLCLTYCGWEICDPGHRFGPNKRISHVLHIVENGSGIFEMDGQRYEINGGEAFFIPSSVEAWYEADMDNPWTYRWVGFEGMTAEEVIHACGFTREKPVRRIHCMENANKYIDGMVKTNKLIFENELKRNGLLMLLFSDLITDNRDACLREGKLLPSHRYPSSAYVENAVDYIAANFDKRLKINELADHIGVNRSYLTSTFKKSLGCSPQEYLMNLRIEKAKSLLKKGDIQVNEVAAKVGYGDPLAFSKVFKARTGKSPREYKEEKRRLVVKGKKGDYTESEP